MENIQQTSILDLIKQQEVNKGKFILSLLLFHNNQIIRKVIWQPTSNLPRQMIIMCKLVACFSISTSFFFSTSLHLSLSPHLYISTSFSFSTSLHLSLYTRTSAHLSFSLCVSTFLYTSTSLHLFYISCLIFV